MFPQRYYGGSYFARRYFAKLGGTIIATGRRLMMLLGVG